MGRLVRLPAAEDDLVAAYVYYATEHPAVAERFLRAAADTFRDILARPQLGRPRDFTSRRLKGIRSAAIRGFRQWLVFYKATRSGVVIVRVLHGARDLPKVLEDDTPSPPDLRPP